MLRFKKAIERQLSRHTQGLLLTTVFIIGAGALVLGGISIRQSIYGPYVTSATDSDIFATLDGDVIGQQIDTDLDGLSDGDELAVYKTSPYLADSDSDTIIDGQEIVNGTDPNCPTGQDCSSAITGTESASTDASASVQSPDGSTTAIPSPSELRALLRQAGMSEQEVTALTDEQLVASYREAQATQQQSSGSQQPAATSQSLQNLSASQLRALLKQSGVDEATLAQVSDSDLLKLYQQTLDELQAKQQP